jgi:hypothetical protein
MQCRIVVNALRREIDRLMRGTDIYRYCQPARNCDSSTRPNGESGSDQISPEGRHLAQLSSPDGNRPAFAVAPLGVPLNAGLSPLIAAAHGASGSSDSPASGGTHPTVIDVLA